MRDRGPARRRGVRFRGRAWDALLQGATPPTPAAMQDRGAGTAQAALRVAAWNCSSSVEPCRAESEDWPAAITSLSLSK